MRKVTLGRMIESSINMMETLMFEADAETRNATADVIIYVLQGIVKKENNKNSMVCKKAEAIMIRIDRMATSNTISKMELLPLGKDVARLIGELNND